MNSRKQPDMVDQILEDAPILDSMPMQPASHGLWNLYEEQGTVTSAGLVDFDDELPEVNSDTKLQQIDLSIIGGKIFCGEDKAKKFGGFPAYIATQLPAILQQTGMDTEKSIIYNNIRQFAEDNHTAAVPKLFNAGGSANANYTILVVNWQPGQITGLFDPAGFGRGALLDVLALNNGGLFEKTIGSKEILVFGARLKSYFGIQLANARFVTAIVNIDIAAADLPTEAQMDDAISQARGRPGRTFIYSHPDVLTAMYKFKGDKLQNVNADREVNRLITAWNSIPWVISYNFDKATESNVVVA